MVFDAVYYRHSMCYFVAAHPCGLLFDLPRGYSMLELIFLRQTLPYFRAPLAVVEDASQIAAPVAIHQNLSMEGVCGYYIAGLHLMKVAYLHIVQAYSMPKIANSA